MKIGTRELSASSMPYLISETSINHNGSLDRAMEMIGVAKDAGVDAVKFQTFHADDVCSPDQMYTYQSQGQEVTEPRIEIFRRSELPDEAWPKLKAECDRIGITFLSTPETPRDLDILLPLGIPAIKIGSDNLTRHSMLRYCARDEVGLPIILSCGMSNFSEVMEALAVTRPDNSAVLVCTSMYPCEAEYVNLLRIATLKHWLPQVPIGYSDHTLGSMAAVMATAMGATIIETHFSLDEKLPGPEHRWAKTPAGLAQWAADIREAHIMRGDGVVAPGKKEAENKSLYQRTEKA